MTFRFVADHAAEWPVAWMCDALDVSESGYHAWAARAPSAGTCRRGRLVAAIEVIHAEVKGRYGSPRMTESGADAAARAGVYVLTRDYLAISVNEETGGAAPRPAAVDGQGGKARCSVILRREGARVGSEK